MRGTATILVVLAIAGLAVPATSCWVHRKSEDLACNTSNDCKGGGTCDNGYCLGEPNGCPQPCTSCDTDELTCGVDCPEGRSCGDLHCPKGYVCFFHCSAGTCGDIDCAEAKRCDIECSGASACHNINCGPAECSISCTGQQGCAAVDCASSCACDVSCPIAVCPSMSCPTGSETGQPCTRSGGRCDSSAADCDRCPLF